MSLRVAPFLSARAASMLCRRMRSCATCRSPPARTARTISSSVAMNGSSSSRRRRMRAGCTSRPRATFSIRMRIASVARKLSGITRRRFALSSSVRSKNCTPCVRFAFGSSETTNRASDAMRSQRIGLRLYAIADDPICSRLERLLDLADRLQHAHVAAELHRARGDAGDRRRAPARRACACTSARDTGIDVREIRSPP